MNGLRRRLLLAGAAVLPAAAAFRGSAAAAHPADAAGAPQRPPRALVFPGDFGAHPDAQIEWWYLTGQLDAPPASAQTDAIGIELTFFRMRTGIAPDNPSRFAAHQLVIAHAAIADPARGALLHDQRIARTGFGVAQAQTGDTRVTVDRWTLARDPVTGRYDGSAHALGFALEFSAMPTQPLLLQGEQGYSRKGSDADAHPAASFYYTEPQLALQARLTVDGRREERQGRGWLDHEWSSTLLPPQAAGWDWGGYNLADGSALTVFRIRGRAGDGADAGSPTVHAYACLRAAGAAPVVYPPTQVHFTPLQFWTSPRTRARYPVAQRIEVGNRTFESQPLMPDQEYDAGAAGGVVYWEGASTLYEDHRPAGRGYLELTGYAGAPMGAGAAP